MVAGFEIINCTFDFTDSPDDIAIKIYLVDESSLLSRLKGWYISYKAKRKYCKRRKNENSETNG